MMLMLIVFGLLVPILVGAVTYWLVLKYLPPAVVKALRESLYRNGKPTQ